MLLTDTEGRLMIANSRALTLFATSEEESEAAAAPCAQQHAVFVGALS